MESVNCTLKVGLATSPVRMANVFMQHSNATVRMTVEMAVTNLTVVCPQVCGLLITCLECISRFSVVLPRQKGTSCSSSMFTCHKSSVCIPWEWKCNGRVDCGATDGSDEFNCGTFPSFHHVCADFKHHNCFLDDFSFWELSEPLTSGLGVAVVSAPQPDAIEGSLVIGLACDVDNYAILLNVHLHNGDVLGFAKRGGEWIPREYVMSTDHPVTMESVVVEVWAVERGFQIAVNGKTGTLFSFQQPSCYPTYVVVGGDVRIDGISNKRRSTSDG